MDYLSGLPRANRLALLAIAAFGVAVATFDLLRKTLLLGATWNYAYPDWHFVYDWRAAVLLVLVLLAVPLSLRRLLALSRGRFIVVLFVVTVVVSSLAFFLTPEKSYQWAMTPHTDGPIESFLYHTTTVLVERGPIEYLSSFHSLETLSGSGRMATAHRLADILRSANYLPFNDQLAAYAEEIKTQRHGPVPPMLVAPFLVLLGTNVQSAVIGSYAVTVTLPVVSYAAFRQYFPDDASRVGALLIMVAPAYLLYQRYGTISYDAISAVLIGISVAFFLRAMRIDSRRLVAMAGMVFSLAALSKVTTLTLVPSYVLAITLVRGDLPSTVKDVAVFTGAAAVVPLLFLLAGYNFLVQYLFDVARVTLNPLGGETLEGAAGSPAVVQELFGWALTVYNARMLGPALLVFATLLILRSIRRERDRSFNEREVIALALLPAFLPFLFLRGFTISRHLLVLSSALGFVALCGYEALPRNGRITLVQVGLLITAAVALVNL